jgi:hypothetical protein
VEDDDNEDNNDEWINQRMNYGFITEKRMIYQRKNNDLSKKKNDLSQKKEWFINEWTYELSMNERMIN